MKHKIVSFLSSSPDSVTPFFEDLSEPPEIEAAGTRDQVTDERACEAVGDATVILAFPFSPYLNRTILEAAKKAKLIQFATVGYDNIDLDAATELGIPVANNPGWNSTSVAEHTIMLILMTLKKALKGMNKFIGEGYTMSERRSSWNDTWELRGKKLGILGLGSIGREVAKLTRVFGASVLYTKRTRLSVDEERELGVEYKSFNELLRESDVLSIHVPLTEDTRGLIGGEAVANMKEGAVIINTARAEIVDEYAVAEALREGRLSGYGADVITSKLVEGRSFPDSPLVGLDNFVLTPHVAGPTKEAVIRSRKQCMGNVRRLILGEKPLYIVNEE
jgi:lactate dehydrogenase-like 2-hydroxyacid dehydrogenase